MKSRRPRESLARVTGHDDVQIHFVFCDDRRGAGVTSSLSPWGGALFTAFCLCMRRPVWDPSASGPHCHLMHCLGCSDRLQTVCRPAREWRRGQDAGLWVREGKAKSRCQVTCHQRVLLVAEKLHLWWPPCHPPGSQLIGDREAMSDPAAAAPQFPGTDMGQALCDWGAPDGQGGGEGEMPNRSRTLWHAGRQAPAGTRWTQLGKTSKTGVAGSTGGLAGCKPAPHLPNLARDLVGTCLLKRQDARLHGPGDLGPVSRAQAHPRPPPMHLIRGTPEPPAAGGGRRTRK